jgi:Fur family transcriptional regulator, ferric uptake regulator
MNVSHDYANELKTANLKITPARLGVLEALENTNEPMDVMGIKNYLKKNKIKADKVTVFRVLNALSEKGLAKSVQLNEGKLRFESTSREDHHHFICEDCGVIEDISDCNIEVIEKEIKKKKGFLVKKHSLEFFGLCKSCQR